MRPYEGFQRQSPILDTSNLSPSLSTRRTLRATTRSTSAVQTIRSALGNTDGHEGRNLESGTTRHPLRPQPKPHSERLELSEGEDGKCGVDCAASNQGEESPPRVGFTRPSPSSLTVVVRSRTVFWTSGHCSQIMRPAQTPLSPDTEWRVMIPSGLYYPRKSKSPPSPSYLPLSILRLSLRLLHQIPSPKATAALQERKGFGCPAPHAPR